MMVIRDCGTHQVEITTAAMATSAITDATAPPGARMGSAAISWAESRFRMAMCEASAMPQASSPPNNEAPIIYRYAFCGVTRCTSNAMRIPDAETSTAQRGDPLAVSSVSLAGAKPSSASEYSIRAVTYKLALDPESAAVRTTKFMMCEMAGMCATSKTVTNGLCVTPTRLHGTTPTRTADAKRYTNVKTAKLRKVARAIAATARASPEEIATISV